jgi:hypothetical protein
MRGSIQAWKRWATMLLCVAAGCGQTRLVDTWVAPTARGAHLSRIAVIFMSADDARRRIAEDAAARAMTEKLEGAQVAPSYDLVQSVEMSNEESMRRKLATAGFDGALVIRPAGVSRRVVGEPPAYAPTFTGYWRTAYPAIYSPGYLREETIVRLDTRLYSVRDDKLLWVGVSKTTDPRSIDRLIHDVARTVAKALAKNDVAARLEVARPPGAWACAHGCETSVIR